MVCTFFGHRECYGLDEEVVLDTVKSLIKNGINHTWGGSYKFARSAKRRGLIVINLGRAEL